MFQIFNPQDSQIPKSQMQNTLNITMPESTKRHFKAKNQLRKSLSKIINELISSHYREYWSFVQYKRDGNIFKHIKQLTGRNIRTPIPLIMIVKLQKYLANISRPYIPKINPLGINPKLLIWII